MTSSKLLLDACEVGGSGEHDVVTLMIVKNSMPMFTDNSLPLEPRIVRETTHHVTENFVRQQCGSTVKTVRGNQFATD